MPSITEDQLTFSFPDGWRAAKFDEWSFYRNQFQSVGEIFISCSYRDRTRECGGELRCVKCGKTRVSGIKAIDILAVETGSQCWLIEIKDYRMASRTKSIDLADEVALKVRDTLAGLVAARVNANDADEKAMALDALRCPQLRVVLHLEQPAKHSRLFPRAIDPANVQQRLKQLIKPIDPHPQVIEMGRMNGAFWSVKPAKETTP